MNQRLGAAKLRKQATAKGICVCGSGMLAGDCCFARGYWHKRAADLQLRVPATDTIVEKCYLSELKSCDGKISGEHFISESVMHLLAGDGKFNIGGTPWLKPGEFKEVGFAALKVKCLCERHNSVIHHLDDAALYFFTRLKACYENDKGPQRGIVSGHDIERWLLKTAKAMAVSGNLGRGNEKLSGEFADGIDVTKMLESPDAWPDGTGLYCVMAAGDTFANHNRFQLAPWMDEKNKLHAFWANILGISFVLLLKPFDLKTVGHAYPVFRPSGINVMFPDSQNTVLLSWDDGMKRRPALGVDYQRRVSEG